MLIIKTKRGLFSDWYTYGKRKTQGAATALKNRLLKKGFHSVEVVEVFD